MQAHFRSRTCKKDHIVSWNLDTLRVEMGRIEDLGPTSAARAAVGVNGERQNERTTSFGVGDWTGAVDSEPVHVAVAILGMDDLFSFGQSI
ncbi:hypothetical protein AWENTII_006833 [Aspergillus wentii]